MKTKAIMAAMLIACSVSVTNAQTMKLILSSGSSLEFKTSEVTRVEFAEAEKKEDKPVTDDGQYHNGHEYVDLGLPSGTLWAKCNIGANSPEEYGDRYAWGETETKSNYSKSTYKYYASSTESTLDADGFTIQNEGYTKYVPKSNSSDGYKKLYDDKTELEPDDDVAHVIWGGDWRIPTWKELGELINNCTWDWTELKGVKGYKVTGKNGKYIFLPANDSHGKYWSSSLNVSIPTSARYLDFYSSSSSISSYNATSRYYGLSVRPVRSK